MSATATDPIPVRALNQVTYCPRLYYLQYVDCVMVNNAHVEAGLFDHAASIRPTSRTRRAAIAVRQPAAGSRSPARRWASPACWT